MKFTLIFVFACFICIQAAPVKKSNFETQECKKEIHELELELKELQKKIIKLKDKIEAKPTTEPTTSISLIEKIRQQNVDEELELEDKQPNKITNSTKKESEASLGKEKNIKDEELELELERETTAEKRSHPATLTTQEIPTAKSMKVSTSVTNMLTEVTTKTKNPDLHLISIRKIRQQEINEEIDLNDKLTEKIEHPKVIKPTPTPIIQEEKLSQRVGHSTKKPAQGKTTASWATTKKGLKETLKHSIQTKQFPSKKIISKELEQERLLEGKKEKKPKLLSEKLQKEENSIQVDKIEKIAPSTISPQLKTEVPVKLTLTDQEMQHSVSPQVQEQTIRPTTHSKITKTATSEKETSKEPLHTTHSDKTPTQMAVTKKSPKHIADLEEELELQLKNEMPHKKARVKKSEEEEDLEKDLKEIALHI